MKKEMGQESWNQIRSAIKQRWGALTDHDLDMVAEKPDRLQGLLQARYGYTREQAEKEIDLLLSKMNTEETNPVEVVRGAFSDSTPEEEAHVEKRVYEK